MAASIIKPEDESFIVRNKKAVLQILNGLKNDATDLKISFNDGKEDYITPIIDVDVDNNMILFDMSIDAAFNKRLLASNKIGILKDSGIRVKWESDQHSLVTLTDGNALRVELPEVIVRLQRRELFRLPTPMLKPVVCFMPVPNILTPNKNDIIEYDLVDVSLGGVGLVVKKSLHPGIKVGDQFENCKINFHGAGEASLTLQVRNIIPIESKSKKQQYRIGLEFIKPSRGNEGIIHKYTFDLERAMLAEKSTRF
jgi:c-di-GMP-binding flagellar brake protein YcgR